MNRGPIAEIDLSALRHNLSFLNKLTDNRPVIAVVKADAYGHGAAAIARELASANVAFLAVAYTGEAIALREAGVAARLLVLFDRTDIGAYFSHDLIPVVQDIGTAREFSKEAGRRRKRITVHMKIDTGMGRMGFRPESVVQDAAEIAGLEGIELGGLMSHFSEADLADRSYAEHQLGLFGRLRAAITERTGLSPLCHVANSAAIFSFREAMLDAVRPGIALYGYSPLGEEGGLTPLMRVKTRILRIRDLPPDTPVSYGRTFVTRRQSRIAVMPIGYGDGFSRLFSNNGEVIVRGKRVPVVGRVCMDSFMIDVTEVEAASEGDEVVLLGRQGDASISGWELASRASTIPYEILTSLGGRSVREYVP